MHSNFKNKLIYLKEKEQKPGIKLFWLQESVWLWKSC